MFLINIQDLRVPSSYFFSQVFSFPGTGFKPFASITYFCSWPMVPNITVTSTHLRWLYLFWLWHLVVSEAITPEAFLSRTRWFVCITLFSLQELGSALSLASSRLLLSNPDLETLYLLSSRQPNVFSCKFFILWPTSTLAVSTCFLLQQKVCVTQGSFLRLQPVSHSFLVFMTALLIVPLFFGSSVFHTKVPKNMHRKLNWRGSLF